MFKLTIGILILCFVGTIYAQTPPSTAEISNNDICYFHNHVFYSSNVCKIACRLGCHQCNLIYVECKKFNKSSYREKRAPFHQYQCVCSNKTE